jgi:hypothetical protein
MAGKYTPLEKYLAGLPLTQREVTLSFEQIERILGKTLPSSAYNHQAWWANEVAGSHVEAHAWLSAGWKVESLDLARKQVRLIRNLE